jgi:hypothetical protein
MIFLKYNKAIVVTVACSLMLLAMHGCSKEAARETAEKTIEKNLAAEGKEAEVTIKPDEESFSMTVKDNEDDGTTTEVQMGQDGGSVVVVDEDGGSSTMQMGTSANIPEGFPKDVPIHSSLKINMSLTDGESGFTLQASSEEKFDNLVYFYTEESRKLGWTEQMNMQQNMETPMQMLVYEKEARMMNLVLQREGDLVNITINVTQE